MLDAYTIGQAGRISPEAPVAVVRVEKTEERPGGAGNVVLNLKSLGLDVAAIGRLGAGEAGERLAASLKSEGILMEGFAFQGLL